LLRIYKVKKMSDLPKLEMRFKKLKVTKRIKLRHIL